MRLLHMYKCATHWLETPAIHPKCAYVYWHRIHTFEEHVETEDVTRYQKVPIGVNPFNQGS